MINNNESLVMSHDYRSVVQKRIDKLHIPVHVHVSRFNTCMSTNIATSKPQATRISTVVETVAVNKYLYNTATCKTNKRPTSLIVSRLQVTGRLHVIRLCSRPLNRTERADVDRRSLDVNVLHVRAGVVLATSSTFNYNLIPLHYIQARSLHHHNW